MLKLYTATVRGGTLVLPEEADLGESRDGDAVRVAVEVPDRPDRAGPALAATRPSLAAAWGTRVDDADLPGDEPAAGPPVPLSPGEAEAYRRFQQTGDMSGFERLEAAGRPAGCEECEPAGTPA